MKEMLGGMVPGQGMSSQVVKNNNDNLIQESEKKFDIPPQMKQRMCGQALELLKTKPNSVDGWASLALLLEGNSEAEVRLPKETVKVNKKQAAQQALANMPSKPSIGQGQLVALLKPLVESEI